MAKKKIIEGSGDVMKIIIALLVLLMIPLTLYAFKSFRYFYGMAASPTAIKTKLTGNGAPNGPHFTLNVLGKPQNKEVSMTGGGRIFVPLTGKTQINLVEGETFAVLDANGTDGSASFQLPNPDPENDGITKYSVWVRALATPGGKINMNTCASLTDPVTGAVSNWCSVETMVAVREAGGSKFSDVSKQLLYVYVDLEGDGTVERYPLFDSALEGYFWTVDTQGMRHLQMRFYQVMSNVN